MITMRKFVVVSRWPCAVPSTYGSHPLAHPLANSHLSVPLHLIVSTLHIPSLTLFLSSSTHYTLSLMSTPFSFLHSLSCHFHDFFHLLLSLSLNSC